MRGRRLLAGMILLASGLVGTVADHGGATGDEPAWVAGTQPRGPIVIDDDDAFTAENGVRSGGGTAKDPYVIANWTIPTLAEEFALRMLDTSAHVVVENLFVPAYTGFAPALIDITHCLGELSTECSRIHPMVDLQGVSNVTLRNVWVTNGGTAVSIQGSQDVHLDDLRLGQRDGKQTMGSGIELLNSQDVGIEGTTVQDAFFAIHGEDVENLTIHGSALLRERAAQNCRERVDGATQCRGASSVRLHERIRNLTVSGTRVHGVSLWLEAAGELALRGNSVDDLPAELDHFLAAETPSRDVLVCGNRFGPESRELTLGSSGPRTRILGNIFEGGVDGLEVWGTEDAEIRGNTFVDHEGTALNTTPSGESVIAGNAFEGNAVALHARDDRTAQDNWWGDASGPSGDGPGEGDAIRIDDDTPFDPWLETPPSLEPTCPDG